MCSLLPANAEDVPRRKAGLWELSTIGAGSGTNKAKTCIGESDKILTPEGGNCTEPKVTKAGEDTVILDVVCTTEQGKETISGAFTGDFSTRYRAQVKMTFDPPPKGMLPYMDHRRNISRPRLRGGEGTRRGKVIQGLLRV